MNKILLGLDMPRTLYKDNDVPPRVHKMRAIGGPIFSTAGLVFSLLWRVVSPSRSLSRELADIASVSHGFILFGALAPLPFVDGGTLLKWTLVEQGLTPDQADHRVHQISTGLGGMLMALGGLLIWRRRRLLGKVALAAGGVSAAAGLNLIK